jgi:hypothetical protein
MKKVPSPMSPNCTSEVTKNIREGDRHKKSERTNDSVLNLSSIVVGVEQRAFPSG